MEKPVFDDLVNKKGTEKVSKVLKVDELPYVKIGNVTIAFNNDPEEDFTKIKTIEDVLDLDIKKVGIIAKITPPLYSAFKGSVNRTIEPHVRKGDTVKFVNKRCKASSTSDEADEFEVAGIEIQSLKSMSIFVASLTNGTKSVLSSYLRKV